MWVSSWQMTLVSTAWSLSHGFAHGLGQDHELELALVEVDDLGADQGPDPVSAVALGVVLHLRLAPAPSRCAQFAGFGPQQPCAAALVRLQPCARGHGPDDHRVGQGQSRYRFDEWGGFGGDRLNALRQVVE